VPVTTGVLFTCAGMRADIVDAFNDAAAKTVAVDIDPLAPALHRAHRQELVPRVDEPDYVPRLTEIVAEHDVALVISFSDVDHAVLARERERIGAVVLLPDAEIVDAIRDKYASHLLFERRGIASPPTWLPEDVPDDLEFPVLVKAREGFGSRHIYRARDRRELEFFLGYTPVPSMVQQCCLGEEFSIDVLCDLDGRCINAIPRTMIESRGGESIKGMTVRDADLVEQGRLVSEALPLKGPGTIQCFREPDGAHRVTDVNARFGGAFPLPLAAGSRYPELCLALARGERVEPRLGDFRDGVVMTRFLSQVVLARNGDGRLVRSLA
jgi:carbamoyl-phosphate synthase large subunit